MDNHDLPLAQGTDLSSSNGDIVITCVHGTFAPGADWTRPESVLLSALKRRFPGAIVQAFQWSGRNSATARAQAAAEFSDWVEARNTDRPRLHFVIAHSHGGNVVLRAMANSATRRAISGVACLSTPFLHVRQRKIGQYGPSYLWALLGATVLILLFTQFAAALGLAIPEDADEQFNAVSTLALLWLWCFVCLELTSEAYLDKKARAFAQASLLPELAGLQMVIVRGTADEAKGGLAAAQFVAWVAGRVWEAMSRFAGENVCDMAARSVRAAFAILRALGSRRAPYYMSAAIVAAWFMPVPEVMETLRTDAVSAGSPSGHLSLAGVVGEIIGLAVIGVIFLWGLLFRVGLGIHAGPAFNAMKHVGFSYSEEPLLDGSYRTAFLCAAGVLLMISVTAVGLDGSLAVLFCVWFVVGVIITFIQLVRATMTKAAVAAWVLCLPVAFIGLALGHLWELVIVALPLSVGMVFMGTILITGLLQVIAMVTAGCCALVMLLVTWAAYGADAARASLSVELAAESSPAGQWTVNEVPGLGESSLVHSTYADPRCVQIVLSWLESALSCPASENACAAVAKSVIGEHPSQVMLHT